MTARYIVGPLVALYLAAILVANLMVATYGAPALAFTAWVLIPFDMVTRDTLQLVWAVKGRLALAVRMFCLIAVGSGITFAVSAGAGPVALASCAAFSCASLIDAAVFAAWKDRLTRLQRVNLSNVCAFIADSLVFQLVAFGALDWSVVASQAGAKTVGGAIWGIIIARTIWTMHTFQVATLQKDRQ